LTFIIHINKLTYKNMSKTKENTKKVVKKNFKNKSKVWLRKNAIWRLKRSSRGKKNCNREEENNLRKLKRLQRKVKVYCKKLIEFNVMYFHIFHIQHNKKCSFHKLNTPSIRVKWYAYIYQVWPVWLDIWPLLIFHLVKSSCDGLAKCIILILDFINVLIHVCPWYPNKHDVLYVPKTYAKLLIENNGNHILNKHFQWVNKNMY
jgi:hypothetical protein